MSGKVDIAGTGNDVTILLDGDTATGAFGNGEPGGVLVATGGGVHGRRRLRRERQSIGASDSGERRGAQPHRTRTASSWTATPKHPGDRGRRAEADEVRFGRRRSLRRRHGQRRRRHRSRRRERGAHQARRRRRRHLREDSRRRRSVPLCAPHAALYVGGKSNEGDVIVQGKANKERIKPRRRRRRRSCAQRERDPWLHFDSGFAALYVGGTGNEGDVIVRDEKNNDRIKLDGGEGDILVQYLRARRCCTSTAGSRPSTSAARATKAT